MDFFKPIAKQHLVRILVDREIDNPDEVDLCECPIRASYRKLFLDYECRVEQRPLKKCFLFRKLNFNNELGSGRIRTMDIQSDIFPLLNGIYVFLWADKKAGAHEGAPCRLDAKTASF